MASLHFLFVLVLLFVFLVDQSTQSGSGISPRKKCRDKVSSCARNKAYCQNYKLINSMKVNCAKTCGHCSTKRRPVCRDLNPQCRNWKRNGFCKSVFYTKSEKKARCAKSCRICK
ncbi:hypothetical protein M3Y94_00933100 [Aphelenchoides besseyi]|nr:hypothetical protein M3Y94_00933100 [Aphelenchoides besseyi]